MLGQADIRFKAVGTQTTQAHQVLFPLRLRAQRPSGEQALDGIRSVVEQLRDAAGQTKLIGTRIIVPDLDTADDAHAADLSIEQKSQREVRLELVFTISLSLDGLNGFWARAGAIARAADLLQDFSQRPREKGIDVDVQRAKLMVGGVLAPETPPASSA
jgi:hypothetical protein